MPLSKICTLTQASFTVSDSDVAFLDSISPTFAGKKYNFPVPNLCPQVRLESLMLWRNERTLYRRASSLSGEMILSNIAPEAPRVVYSTAEYLGDSWSGLDYGLDIDPDKTFTQQFRMLEETVPTEALVVYNSENTEYGNDTENCKNSYLVFNSYDCIDSSYATAIGLGASDIMDAFWVTGGSQQYSTSYVKDSAETYFSHACQDMSRSWFCLNCTACQDCFGCVGLVNARYCMFGEQLTATEYAKKFAEIRPNGSYKHLLQVLAYVDRVWGSPESRALRVARSEDCTGDIISDSKSIQESYSTDECRDAHYLIQCLGITGALDCFNAGMQVERLYQMNSCYWTSNSAFCSFVYKSSFCYYCDRSSNLTHCFGCVGLKDQKYCIFNKQYTPEEYERLVGEITTRMQISGEWGKFFDPSLSAFGYDETVAPEYFPLTESGVIARGYNWKGYKPNVTIPTGMRTTLAADLPDRIQDVPDSILDTAIICEVSARPFRIIERELAMYRATSLPLPRRHPDVRHLDRLERRRKVVFG